MRSRSTIVYSIILAIAIAIAIAFVPSTLTFGQDPLLLPSPSCADGRCQLRLPEPRLTREAPIRLPLPVAAPVLRAASPCPGAACTPVRTVARAFPFKRYRFAKH